MGIDNIGGPGLRQEKTDCGSIRTVQSDQVRTGLSNQAQQPSLASRTSHHLCERGGGNRYPHSTLFRPHQQYENPAVMAIQRNQSAGIESNAAQAALRPLETFFDAGDRISSAQARSFGVTVPPVCQSDSASISLHPAISESATVTACFINADTLAACPAATKERTSRICSSSKVIVILAVAIPITIPRAFRQTVTAAVASTSPPSPPPFPLTFRSCIPPAPPP